MSSRLVPSDDAVALARRIKGPFVDGDIAPGAGELGGLADERGKERAGAELIEESGGEGHCFPSSSFVTSCLN